MTSLLPESSGLFEKALESTFADRWSRMNGAVPSITTAKENPPPSFLPFLVWEYGLGMLTPYVSNVYDLIEEGIDWHRIRGTYGGVEMGLGFISVTATVEPAWHGRAWWNSSQLRFPVLPANDAPLLGQIEGITRLSLPLRSDLRRGVHEYDIPPVETDGTLLDGSLLEEESGIRLVGGATVWSFGRTTEFDHTLTEAEGTAIGNWVAVPSEGGGIPWASMTYPWATATFPWAANADAQRRSLMAAWFDGREMYAVFRDIDDEIIGYRRVRVARAVQLQFGGPYLIGESAYAAIDGGQIAYIETMTDFADADGIEARAVSIATAITKAAGVPSGRLWLRPQDVTASTEFASKTITMPLRRTVRERVKFLVRF